MPRQRSGEPVPSFDPATLKRTRQARHMSHDALGRLVGIPRPALIAYEQGRVRPGIEALVALADALELDAFELMGADPAAATLAQLRARAGLTKTAIADRTGVARSTWALVERGDRTLQPDVANRVAELLEIDTRQVHAAHGRGARSRRASALTQTRHFALQHHLGSSVAAEPSDSGWIDHRARLFAQVAGVAIHAIVTTAEDYTARTGVPVDPDDWGKASWEGGYHVIYVDPSCGDGTKATVDIVIAHEVAHLRWPSLGHRQTFFDRAQHLLDRAAALDGPSPRGP